MSRRQSRYRKHLTIYVNHSDLDKKLKESDRTKSIIGFLWLGLAVLIVGIIVSIGWYIALMNNKTTIASSLQFYTSGIIAQLPANMTGSLTLSWGSATLHLNNDKPFVIDLTKDMNQKMDNRHLNDIPTKILIDTSLTAIPSSKDYMMIITKNAFAVQQNHQWKMYDFNKINEEETDYQEDFFLTQAMIQNAPSQIAWLVEEHIGSIAWWIITIALLIGIFFETILLVIIAIWYFFLCFVIRCLLSIVTSIRKKEIPHKKRDLICILGFGPFIISFFFLSGRLYVIAIFIYLSILITQHHEFHQKR